MKKKTYEIVVTPETEAAEIGAFLRTARTAIGMVQTAIAAEMGIAQNAVARLEGGSGYPTLPTLGRFAQALGMRCVVRFEP